MRGMIARFASRYIWRSIPSLPVVWHLGRSSQSFRIPKELRRINCFHDATFAQYRLSHTAAAETDESDDIPEPSYVKPGAETLPVACPGCGAFTQWVAPEEAGFYSFNRKAVKQYIRSALSARKGYGSDDASLIGSFAENKPGKAGVEPETGVSGESQLDTAITGTNGEKPPDATSVAEESEKTLETQTPNVANGSTAQDQSLGPVPETQENGEITLDEVPESNPGEESTLWAEKEKKPQVAADPTSTELNSKKETVVQREVTDPPISLSPPLCDRCHNIQHHNTFNPIPYPPISYIRDIMDESPFDHNHVYHVVDAADFPLSMITNIYRHLDVQEMRSRNRRSKPDRFRRSKAMADLHIVITRADLLAPTSGQVDKLMPVMIDALRDALGSKGQKLRLGNVHMVSAHRGWRTRDIKEKIWKHGGAVWMVGKTNVGKSNLINAVFPKVMPGRGRDSGLPQTEVHHSTPSETADVYDELDDDSLLPPPQKGARWPILPVISPGPGTTASPIRIPFGRKRGEVIDLPGLNRNGLEEFVKDEQKVELVTVKRPKPDRVPVKAGHSLLLDRLIRITPLGEDMVLMAPFVPLEPLVTPTKKAGQIVSGECRFPSKYMAKDDVSEQISSAGVFELNWDVTSVYRDNRHMEDETHRQLSRSMGVDILIEGCGWIELLCQVRTKNRSPDDFPKVEIFSPRGTFVSVRRPLCAWRFILEKRQEDRASRNKKMGRRRVGAAR